MEINQSKGCKQAWDSLQRCVDMFPPSDSHIDIGCTL